MVINSKHYDIDNKVFPLGWSFDNDYGTERLVFRKKEGYSDSACFVYYKYELEDHLKSKCLTNLEFLEGLDYYNKSGIQQRREDALMALKPRDEYFSEGANVIVTRR